MAQLDDQLAALRTQAQAAVQRGDIQAANALGAQAAQLRAGAGATAAPAPNAAVAPAPAPSPQAAPVRSSGARSVIQPQDAQEAQLFAQARQQRAAGQTAQMNHTLRMIAIRRVSAAQGNQGYAFGLNIISPISDYLGAAFDTFATDHAHGESRDFGTNLRDREQLREGISRTNPVSAGAGTAAGFLATAPLAEAALGARAVQAAPTVGRLAATAGVQGAVFGAARGSEHAVEEHQSLPQAVATIAGQSALEAGENAAGAWLLGHVGRAAFGGLRAMIGNFTPTQRGFAALARTDAARSLGLTPANLLAASNRFRAAAGRNPSPMEIMQAAGEQSGNPLAARTVGQLVGRSPQANAVLTTAARASEPSTTQTSNALFAHLDNVAVDTNTNAQANAFFARPNVQRVIRMIRSSDPEMGARLDAASDGTAPLMGRDADFLRRTLAKGGTGPSGIRFGSVQLANDVTGILDGETNGQYSTALAQHGANKATLETAGSSVRDVARPNAASPQAETNAGTEVAGHAVAAIVGHGPGALAYRAARLASRGIAGISNRQAEAVSRYLAAQGPDAVSAFSQALQRARGTAQATAIVRDVLVRSALGLAHGAAQGENVDNGEAAAAEPAQAEVVAPTTVAPAAGQTRITAQDIPQAYLDAMTQRESGGRADASNPQSSAQGSHQFIQSTFLRTIRQHADELGMQNVAAHIGADGSVDDPNLRARILALRNNAEISGLVARAFTADNANYLTDKLGHAPSNGELYAAHVLGPAGAYHLISAAQSNVSNAAAIFPKEAEANHNLFYQGRTPLSAAAVLAKLNL